MKEIPESKHPDKLELMDIILLIPIIAKNPLIVPKIQKEYS